MEERGRGGNGNSLFTAGWCMLPIAIRIRIQFDFQFLSYIPFGLTQ